MACRKYFIQNVQKHFPLCLLPLPPASLFPSLPQRQMNWCVWVSVYFLQDADVDINGTFSGTSAPVAAGLWQEHADQLRVD